MSHSTPGDDRPIRPWATARRRLALIGTAVTLAGATTLGAALADTFGVAPGLWAVVGSQQLFSSVAGTYTTSDGAVHQLNAHAGLFHIINKTKGNADAYAYCIDISHKLNLTTDFSSDQNIPTSRQITYILNHYFNDPAQAAPAGHAQNLEAAAVQAAIWHYSDNFALTGADPVVTAEYAAIVAATDANSGTQSPPTSIVVTLLPPPAVAGGSEQVKAVVAMGTHALTGATVTFTIPATEDGSFSPTSTVKSTTAQTGSDGSAVVTVFRTTAGAVDVTASVTSVVPGGLELIPLDTTSQVLVLAAPTSLTQSASVQAIFSSSPAIATTPSTGGVVGTLIHDTAQVTGGSSPTGQVRFDLHAPGDTSCTGAPVFTDTETLANGVAMSKAAATRQVGTYRWVASYLGDTINAPAVSGCQAEQVTTSVASPAIATQPSLGGVVGTLLSDTATVSGGFSPTGTVSFVLHGPTDTECTGTPVFTDTETLVGGRATSRGFTSLLAGVHRWVATYSGDVNNASVVSGCQDELATTTKASPAIATTPSAGGDLPVALHDSATVSGGVTPTGTVAFSLFAPSDVSCTATPVFADTEALSNGVASSRSYTAITTGTFHWIATYSGDSNNTPASSGCTEEAVTVSTGGVLPTATPSPQTTPTSTPSPTPSSGVQALATTAPTTGAHLPVLPGALLLLTGVVLMGAGLAPRRNRPEA